MGQKLCTVWGQGSKVMAPCFVAGADTRFACRQAPSLLPDKPAGAEPLLLGLWSHQAASCRVLSPAPRPRLPPRAFPGTGFSTWIGGHKPTAHTTHSVSLHCSPQGSCLQVTGAPCHTGPPTRPPPEPDRTPVLARWCLTPSHRCGPQQLLWRRDRAPRASVGALEDSIPGLGTSLEKGTASHSSVLAWIVWSVGSQRAGQGELSLLSHFMYQRQERCLEQV